MVPPHSQGEAHLVHEVLVQVFDIYPRTLPELGPGTDADCLTAGFASPNGQGITPVAVAAYGPVPGSLQPFAEATVPDMGGYPEDFLIAVYHVGLYGINFDKPGAYSPVDKGAGATPAMGIGMEDLLALDQLALCLKTLHDCLVAVLDELALIIAHFFGKFAFRIHRAYGGNTGALEHLIVVLAKTRSCMHDARTVFGGNIVTQDRDEGSLVVEGRKIGKKGFVAYTCQFFALLFPGDGESFRILVIRRKPGLCQDIALVAVHHADVVDFGA